MNRPFGDFLKALRLQRGLSQAQLAHQANVVERTLRYWESGQWSPSNWELESVLAALKATVDERAQALARLTTRRGIHLARQETQSQNQWREESGPLPGTGDLLQAMRIRQRLTQEQLAIALGISRSTVVRWEASEVFPSDENLERACALLGAYPEERSVLSSRHILPGGWDPELSLDACAAQTELLAEQGVGLLTPLIDLYALALKRQLWLQASKSEEALRLLAKVHVTHAGWLVLQDRGKEARACVRRSLQIVRDRFTPESFWQAGVNLASLFESERAEGNVKAVHLLQRWMPLFPSHLQTTLWCDMAYYAAKAQDHEAAGSFLAKGHDTLSDDAGDSRTMTAYYSVTSARVHLSSGRLEQALEGLPALSTIEPDAARRSFYLLLWADAFLQAGEKAAAQSHLDQLSRLLEEHPHQRAKRRLTELFARL